MSPRRDSLLLCWLIAFTLALGAGPTSVLVAYEPACRMDCADTEYCCCKPRVRVVPDHDSLQGPVEQRETCPDGCASLAFVPQLESAAAATTGSVARDSDAETIRLCDERFVSSFARINVEPRAPPPAS